MENSLKYSPVPYSPNRHYSSISSSGSSAAGIHHHPPPSPAAVPITRSDPTSPCPTTFVQANTSSFKQVVQMLTGSVDTARLAARPDPTRNNIPPAATNGPRKDKSGPKLYERRSSLKDFRISPLGPGMVGGARPGFLSGYSGSTRPGTPEILSPSILDFPSLVLSPVTPLIPDPFNREAAGYRCDDDDLDKEAEDRAIQGKGFYLHRSPASTPRDSEPRLLPLFPVTSPRVARDS